MNNLLKSLFISAYAPYSVVLTIIAARELLRQWGPAWLGVLLISAPVAAFFGWLMIFRNMPRSHPLLPWLGVTTIAGAVLATTALFTTNYIAALLAAVGVMGYALYIFWYSRFGRSPTKVLRLGDPLPKFASTDSAGVAFSTADLEGKPAVLLFYRGNWCPLCMAQVKEIAAAYQQLADRRIQVVLISPQSQNKTAALASRFAAPMRFVTDPNNQIARQLGIEMPHGLPAGMQLLGYASESVLPTVIVINENGRIVMADQTDNYRVRPEPATFIAALDAQQH